MDEEPRQPINWPTAAATIVSVLCFTAIVVTCMIFVLAPAWAS